MVRQDLVGDGVGGEQTRDEALPRDRAGPSAHRRAAAEAAKTGVDVHAPGFSEVPGQQVEQLLEVGVERAVRCLLDAQILEDRDPLRRDHQAHEGANVGLVHACAGAVVGDRDVHEGRTQLVDPARVVLDEVRVSALLEEESDHRAEQESVAPGPDLEVQVGDVRGLGAAGVDHDQRAVWVPSDLLQRHAGAREAVGLPGVLAEEDRHLGMLEVRGGVAPRLAVQLGVHPELAGLLLGERVGAEDAAEGAEQGPPVERAAEVVRLAAAAVIENGLAAVLLPDREQSGRDLGDRDVPRDPLVGAVRPSPQGAVDTVLAVLVVVQLRGFLAHVALRRGMSAVALYLEDPPPFGAHLQAAVDAAQDTRRRLPVHWTSVSRSLG